MFLFQKKKIFCLNLNLPTLSKSSVRKSRKEENGSSTSSTKKASPNVNEEYKQAFRTRSYIEISTKIQNQIETRTSPQEDSESYIHLSEDLLEPYQDALNSLIQASKCHRTILINFFEITLQACRLCESLLENVRRARNRSAEITRVVLTSPKQGKSWNQAVYRHLNSFSLERNPFSETTPPAKFRELHATHRILLQRLTSLRRRTRQKLCLIKFTKRAAAGILLTGFGALLATAVLVLAVHSVAGLALCPLGLFLVKSIIGDGRRRGKRRNRMRWWSRMEVGAIAELDIAARGVYIMIKDLDTTERLVRRVEDEMEHRRAMAEMCVRKGERRCCERVLLRELEGNEEWFQEQLEELERQIYLCFLDIDRARRLLVREMGTTTTLQHHYSCAAFV